MKRCNVGKYEVTSAGGEEVRAFIPNPLPPEPPIDIASLLPALSKALISLGRLDGLARILPSTLLFLYSYVRKEAVLSSQIEGTQSSISDLMLFEIKDMPGAPTEDVVEVSNYVRALEHGLTRITGGFPLSNRLIREIHRELLSRDRGDDKLPGEFRQSQNWIGGTRPGTAYFVPPPPHAVQACMSDLEQFLHWDASLVDPLVKAGIAHLQFETIHPFLDGNGRVGRLLITLLLCHDGLLQHPLLYLSLYFKENRGRYYDLLDSVRTSGDWEAWLDFYLEGVAQTADAAVQTAEKLLALFDEDESVIPGQGRAAGSAIRVHQALKERPIVSLKDVTQRTGLSLPAATSGMRILEELSIVAELTGMQRNRLFGYEKYLAIMSEGAEPL